jgi:CRP-like cAMP-binding protein
MEAEGAEGCELFSREDLGAVLGLTTETASRTMAELKRQGFISEPRFNHFLCDIVSLRRALER